MHVPMSYNAYSLTQATLVTWAESLELCATLTAEYVP